ncbi:MAG: hypothetical protein HYX68_13340 [Planctomycetes bacterium]|jgi:hypothetical protein|nr:hypothetical protein [Planctomycetota bacterium]
MAGLKKKKKEKSGSPNVVLVVFLVLFVIVSITLGVLLYYALQEKDDANTKRILAKKESDATQKVADYYSMLYFDARTQWGDRLDADEADKSAKDQMVLNREEFLKPNFGNFAGAPATKESALKFMNKIRDNDKLGKANNGDYKLKIDDLLKTAKDEAAKWKADYFEEAAKNARMEKLSAKLTEKQDTFHKELRTSINTENANILKAAQVKSDEFKDLQKAFTDLKTENEDKDQKLNALKESTQKQINKLTRQVNILEAERREMAGAGPGGGGNPNRGGGEAFPLLLDLSTGKPLWDAPVGKIVRVDLEIRQVTINLGKAHGIVPEVTFNIFAAGANGRAEKQMKGSIEVIKVIDANTSQCRINVLYDVEGREIVLNNKTRFQLIREAEAPLREGDLLYNLFWGTRVAVAGYVDITGDFSHDPAEQNRQMEDFIYLLKRNGMQVDAFVDLRDGQIKGKITPRTRYLINGLKLKVAKADAEKMGDDEKGKEPNADRNATVNKASATLRKEAIDGGLLMISPENFATVIGYRRARNANTPDISTFRPSLPYAGKAEQPKGEAK